MRRFALLAVLLSGLGFAFLDATAHHTGRVEVKPTVQEGGSGFPTPFATPPPKR